MSLDTSSSPTPKTVLGAWMILMLCLCIPLLGFQNVSPRSLEIIPHWKKGEKIELAVTRARDKSLNGQSTLSGKTHTRFSLEVLRADPQGYLVGWTVGATTFAGPAPSESLLRQVVGLMQGMQIVLIIDPRGTITGVQNWKALRHEMRRNLDALVADTSTSQQGNQDHALMDNLRVQWDTLFSTKVQVEKVCTRDARTYFRILGRTYTLHQHDEHQSVLDNPLGGPPLPAHTDTVLKSFDHRSGHAVLHWNQSADRKQTERIMRSMIKDLAAQRGKQVPEEGIIKTVALENHAEIEVDVGTGWITTLTETKSVNLGTRAQTDTTFFVRIDP